LEEGLELIEPLTQRKEISEFEETFNQKLKQID